MRHWRSKLPPRPRRERDADEFASFQVQRPRARMVADLDKRAPVVVEKDDPLRSEPYRRLVAAMDCIHCGKRGPSQCAHADSAGKGMALKPDDRESFPACATSPGRAGCHDIIGSTGYFTKDQRRALEKEYARRTREAIMAAGTWPKELPLWLE